tara:strand:+ start:93 stop:302 length:210 start_codon:yes stop_codon:yes gene_type:complete
VLQATDDQKDVSSDERCELLILMLVALLRHLSKGTDRLMLMLHLDNGTSRDADVPIWTCASCPQPTCFC